MDEMQHRSGGETVLGKLGDGTTWFKMNDKLARVCRGVPFRLSISSHCETKRGIELVRDTKCASREGDKLGRLDYHQNR